MCSAEESDGASSSGGESPTFGVPQYQPTYSAYSQHASWRPVDTMPEVCIVPKEWNQADNFNYGKVPSGILISTAGGQTVEMWQGVHVPQSWAVSNGVPSE